MVPGSMPAGSTSIWQEGLILPPVRLTTRSARDPRERAHAARSAGPTCWRRSLRTARRAAARRVSTPWPRGRLVAFDEVIAYAERRAREAIAPARTAATRPAARSRATVSPTTTSRSASPSPSPATRSTSTSPAPSPAAPGNVNAPLAVTRVGLHFAVEVCLGADVPVNAGLFATVYVRAPEGCLVNAQPPSAVVAGNVETSQRIADTVLLALSQAADVPRRARGR